MLLSLELNGFKSFAKKSELEFGSSVTAIVGPNGSGKSNVVEAFRFVLGEQSIKSMRGKSGSDLIFKGSKTIAKLNRAKVTIIFDNKKKIFKITPSEGEQFINLDFDTIEISREVFADGTNKYTLNNTEVRLKDIHEILASVHIGSSGHHIISQGQADRLLSANSKERRTMIEDALGLKVYQIKIKDAEKKIEKTEHNIQEVESLRREIAPHLRYLKKQVEKVKQSEELRSSLAGMYREYLAKQNYILNKEYGELIQDQTHVSDELSRIDGKLSAFEKEEHFSPDSHLLVNIKKEQDAMQHTLLQKDELSRAMTRLEVLLEIENKKSNSEQEKKNIIISSDDFDSFLRDMNVFLDQASKTQTISDVQTILGRIRNSLSHIQKYSHHTDANTSLEQKNTLKEMTQKLADIKQEFEHIIHAIEIKRKVIQEYEASIETARAHFYESQRERFEIEKERATFTSQQELIHERIARVRESRLRLEEEIREGVVLVGKEILSYGEYTITTFDFDRTSIDEIRRNIERLKIKIEEAGASGGEEALKEFEEVSERDSFLERELSDLTSALISLKALIEELKDSLDNEFQNGIQKINKEFKEFFSLMFGGGDAKLSIVAGQTKKKIQKDDDVESITDEKEEEKVEDGVEIEVSLPHKKVRELAMLSGGERSLTSIALLFAMSQVNPPPFLVLDETDAALDEANSRRYGDMIEKLSEYSQLIVVTHNRETMSRAKTLYGVTVGADGASKLLSIKFNDAEAYAK